MNRQVAHGFVIMPFGDEGGERFWRHLEQAADVFQFLTVERFNSAEAPSDDIFASVLTYIRRADFVISDFTPKQSVEGINRNVLTEAGMAKGMGKDVHIVMRTTDSQRRELIAAASDWNGHLVHLVSNDDNARDELADLFERILTSLGFPTARKSDRPRKTQGEQFEWLVDVLSELRKRCRVVYEFGSQHQWICKQIRSDQMPASQFFEIVRADDAASPRVRVGVFLDDELSSPFRVVVREHGEDREVHPIDVSDVGRINEIPMTAAIEAFLKCLDACLLELAPSIQFTRTSDLASFVRDWDEYLAELESVCEELHVSGELLRRSDTSKWRRFERVHECDIPHTHLYLKLGLQIRRWAEYDISPCWIEVRTTAEHATGELPPLALPDAWQPIWSPSSCLVPVPLRTPGEFRGLLTERLRRIIQECQG